VKITRKQISLEKMEQGLPWAVMVEHIALYYAEGKREGKAPLRVCEGAL
jgi:hypothetical protein